MRHVVIMPRHSQKGNALMLLTIIRASEFPAIPTTTSIHETPPIIQQIDSGNKTCTQHLQRLLEDGYIYTKNSINNNECVQETKNILHNLNLALGIYFFGPAQAGGNPPPTQPDTMEQRLHNTKRTLPPTLTPQTMR